MNDNRTPEPRRSAIYDLALSLGRVEGMVSQALTYLGDYGKKLEDHDKRITELETQERIRKAQMALIATIVTCAVSGVGWIVQHADKFF